ncbi:MAG: WYL domain-containing protein [Chloroflexaceae bacterium]|nr:WYL domain-containing protein [Chloroflexaceae bacterium]
MASGTLSSEPDLPLANLPDTVYGVVRRLIGLRAVLHHAPQSFAQIRAALPDDYPANPTGQRKLLRDIEALSALGFTLEQHRRAGVTYWHIRLGPPLLSDQDVQALRYIRAAFPDGSPYTPPVAQLLEAITAQLTPAQQRVWQRPLAVQLAVAPVQDYQHTADLLQWLEQVIHDRHQISLRYHARQRERPIWHPRLDPYQIVYRDEQFFLEAYSYASNRVLQFRLDRIVYDPHGEEPSPMRLPSLYQGKRSAPEIIFRYQLAASFTREGVSARFTIHDVEEREGVSIITASHPNELHIIRTLLAYGEHARLLDGPPQLLSRFRATIQAMYGQYSKVDTTPDGQ